jgi:protein disulfide-isomerase A1
MVTLGRASVPFLSLLLVAGLAYAQEDDEVFEDYADEYGGSGAGEPDPWGKSNATAANGILEMHDRNLDIILGTYDHVIVQFYAPWCWHSQDLDVKYFEAAKKALDDPNNKVVFAKFDRSLPWYAEIMQWYGIPPATPTVRLFYKGQPLTVPKDSMKSVDTIMEYTKKASDFKFPVITTTKEANSIAKKSKFAVFSFWDSIDDNLAISDCMAEAAFGGENDDVPFVVTTSKDLMKKFKVTAPAVVVLRQFDEPKKLVIQAEKLTSAYCKGERSLNDAKKLWANDITSFISEYKIPTMITFDNDAVAMLNDKFPRLFANVLWVFVDKQSGYEAQVRNAVAEHARERKARMLTFMVTDRKQIAHMMGHFKLLEKPPLAMMAHFNRGRSKQDQYILVNAGQTPESFTAAALGDALQKFDDGKLNLHVRSEKPNPNQVGALKQIVALEWDNRVIRPQKDVLVLFTHRGLCLNSGTACADVKKQVKEVAMRLNHVDTVTVLTMDMQDNEVDITFVNRAMQYPLLVLFPATNKDQHVNFKWKTGLATATAEMILKALKVNAHILFEYKEEPAKSEL